MGLSVFGYILFAVLICAPICALWALNASRIRSRFQIVDIGTLFLPPVAFFFVGYLRHELRFGWALFFWPIIIAVVTMYALPLKAVALNLTASSPKRLSSVLFLGCLIAAVLLAFMVPPWYD